MALRRWSRQACLPLAWPLPCPAANTCGRRAAEGLCLAESRVLGDSIAGSSGHHRKRVIREEVNASMLIPVPRKHSSMREDSHSGSANLAAEVNVVGH